MSPLEVRADIFGSNADTRFYRSRSAISCPLLREKRTCRFALQMSAYDPKRTLTEAELHWTFRYYSGVLFLLGENPMKRREFITLLGGAAAGACSLTARAQQTDRIRRVGVLMNVTSDDPEGQRRLSAFRQELQQSGWNDGGNVRIDIRWGANDVELDRKYASELLALGPDAILAVGTLGASAIQRVARTVPIIFVNVSDPVGVGIVDNLSRPGGNTTGFMLFEYSLSGKWLELLKQAAPSVKRVLVLRNAANPAAIGQFGAIQSSARSHEVEVSPANVHEAGEIERAIAAFGRSSGGGLIVTPSASESHHRDLIIKLAAQYKLPAVYAYRSNAIKGGLISYGPDELDQFKHGAEYIDRVLKGEKPGELPVQAPTKYQLVINLKAAKALGLPMPSSVLARADEVIEQPAH
jgi:putative ABC transport system substrate-binding protein